MLAQITVVLSGYSGAPKPSDHLRLCLNLSKLFLIVINKNNATPLSLRNLFLKIGGNTNSSDQKITCTVHAALCELRTISL